MSAGNDDDESEEEDAARPSKAKKASKPSFRGQLTSQGSSFIKQKKKKKKGTGVSTPAIATAPAPAPAPVPAPAESTPPKSPVTDPNGSSGMSKKERKALKKQKAKDAKGEGDELDRALAELSLKHPELKQATQNAPATRASSKFFSLLLVSLSNLDAEAEMRKFFGSKVIAASKASGSGSSNAQAKRRQGTMRSVLTRPQDGWWPANHRQGLSSRVLTEEELAERQVRHQWNNDVAGEKIWTVEYSRKYRGLTKTFIQMVLSGGVPIAVAI